MPTIIVQGRQVPVSDSFFRLSPEEQGATVKEITEQMAWEAITATPRKKSVQPPMNTRELSQPEHSWSELPGNVVPSAVNTATGLWDMVTHPQRTAETIVDAAQGGADRIVPEAFTNFMDTYVSPRSPETRERQRQVSGALGQALKDRYWGLENLKKTMITDPVGIVLDVGGIAAGGAGLVRGPLAIGSKVSLAESPAAALNVGRPAIKKLGPTIADDDIRLAAGGKLETVKTGANGAPSSDSIQAQYPFAVSAGNRPQKVVATTSGDPSEVMDIVPKSPITASADTLEAKFTKSGDTSFKPTFVKYPVPAPHILRRVADPYDVDFRIPRKPGKRSSPWVAQYPPIVRPARGFRLDYPNGALTDADGILQFDMERRPLTAKNIAGRRRANEPDYPLTPDAISSIIYKDAGVEIAPARPNALLPGTIGQLGVFPDGRLAEINFWDELPGDQADVTIAHEFGHLLDEIAGRISTKEIDDELIPLYSAHSTGRIGPPFLLPENRGYRPGKAPRERAAEAFRIYGTGPNTMKSMAPKAAAALRTLNTHPFFSKFIQFNGIPIGVTTGAAATAAAVGAMGQSDESNAAEAPPQRDTQTNYLEGIGSIPGPSVPFGLAGEATKTGAYGLTMLAKALSQRGLYSQAPKNEKFRDIARALVDLETKRKKPQFYGGPR